MSAPSTEEGAEPDAQSEMPVRAIRASGSRGREPREDRVIAVVAIVVAVVALGISGYALYKANDATSTTAKSSTTKSSTTKPSTTTKASTGAPPAVPALVGQNFYAAAAAIDNAGLKLETQEKPSPTVHAGRVISQSPPAGGSAAAGSTVTLVVSSGP